MSIAIFATLLSNDHYVQPQQGRSGVINLKDETAKRTATRIRTDHDDDDVVSLSEPVPAMGNRR